MSTISASTTSTTAYKVTADTTGTLVLQTGSTPTTAMTIDGSQNVGIGTAPSAWTTFAPVLQIKTGTGAGALTGTSVDNFRMFSNTYYDGAYKRVGAGYATQYEQAAGAHVWYTAGTSTANSSISFNQAMTLDSSGNLLVGTTSSLGGTARLNVSYNFTNDGARWKSDSTSNHNAIVFMNPNGDVGAIRTNGSATTYNTSSDYRLKENIAPMTGALSVVAALKPCTYTWKVDGAAGQGFIAHELQAVVPDCVSGEKDAVDDDGNPVYQGIDTSFLVATLTAAIQELKAELDAAKADIATLKGAA